MSVGWSARPEVAAEVSRLLASEVRARGVSAETESGGHSGSPRIRLDGVSVDLHALVEACAAIGSAEWPSVVRSVVDDAVGSIPTPGEMVGAPAPGSAVVAEVAQISTPAPARPEGVEADAAAGSTAATAGTGAGAANAVPAAHLDGLRSAIRARLLPEPPAGADAWHYAHAVAPGLRLGLELAHGSTRRLLLDSELPQVPIPVNDLFAAGWRNAWAELASDRDHAPGIRALEGAYIATRVAEFGPVAERLGDAPHGLVIAAPTPHTVLVHVVRRDTVLIVEELAAEAERLAASGGITARLYYWSAGRLEPIDLDGSPDGRFATALATALI